MRQVLPPQIWGGTFSNCATPNLGGHERQVLPPQIWGGTFLIVAKNTCMLKILPPQIWGGSFFQLAQNRPLKIVPHVIWSTNYAKG